MKIETQAIHAGYTPEPTTNAVAVPIYQTASYSFNDTQHGADLFNLEVAGNIYTRIMNPTNDALEKRVAEMEGGVGALAVASGMAAITYAIQTLASAGDNIVSTNKLYGGTYTLFSHILPKQGIEARFAPYNDIDKLISLIDEKTKAVFCETIGNPAGNVIDIARLAEAAHKKGVPVIVDNTVASPYLCKPFDFGADIVIHSLTKYMGGHGTTIAGIVVDSGNFPWEEHADRYPQLTQPDPSYHDVIFTKDFGQAAFIGRCRTVPLRTTGAALSPFNAFLILQGIETLPLRMDRHCENTIAAAEYLNSHNQVKWVNYSGLPSSPDNAVAKKITKGKGSGILSFGIEGGIEAGTKFIDALQLITRLVNIGDAKSLACHPASTTHRQLNDKELESAGVSKDMIRLSIGIEHIDDIIADITQALDAAK